MPTRRDDLLFGGANERDSLPRLRDHFATPSLEKTPHTYDLTDFVTPDGSLYVELKSRRIASGAYPTAIVGANKVREMKRRTAEGAKCYFAFCYTDGLFVIPYSDDVFDTFERNESYWRGRRDDCRSHSQSIVYIPIASLTKV